MPPPTHGAASRRAATRVAIVAVAAASLAASDDDENAIRAVTVLAFLTRCKIEFRSEMAFGEAHAVISRACASTRPWGWHVVSVVASSAGPLALVGTGTEWIAAAASDTVTVFSLMQLGWAVPLVCAVAAAASTSGCLTARTWSPSATCSRETLQVAAGVAEVKDEVPILSPGLDEPRGAGGGAGGERVLRALETPCSEGS